MLKIRFDVALAAGFILSTWVPLVGANVGSIAAKVFFISWLLCTWGRHFATCMRYRYATAVVTSFLLFAAVDLAYVFLTDDPSNPYYGVALSTWKGYVWTFCFWMVLHYYLAVGYSLALKQLVFFFIAGVTVTALLTLWGIGQFGETVARSMVAVTVDSDRDELLDAIDASQMGVASFNHIYGMMLMVTPLFYSLRYLPRKQKQINMIIILLLVICVYKASFLTAVLALAFGGLVALAMKQRSLPPTLVWGGGLALLVVFLFSSSTFVVPLLNSIEHWSWVQSSQVYSSKVEDFRAFFTTRDSENISRFQRIGWSWNLFLKSPLFGNGLGDVGMGGHSEIFDQLGRFGLIGSIPLVVFLYWLNKYLDVHLFNLNAILKRLKKTLILPFIFVAFFNPISHGAAWSVFLFFVPALVFVYLPQYSGIKPLQLSSPGTRLKPVVRRPSPVHGPGLLK